MNTYRTQTPCGVFGGGESREKMGYGDGGSFLNGMIYNFGSDAYFSKWLQDCATPNRPKGKSPTPRPVTCLVVEARPGVDKRANWSGALIYTMGTGGW